MSFTVDLDDYSELQVSRLGYAPPQPAAFASGAPALREIGSAAAPPDEAALRSWFPLTYSLPLVDLVAGASASSAASPAAPRAAVRVGVVFCGRQTPGAHSFVAGLLDGLAASAPGSELLGFIGGTRGLFAGSAKTLDAAALRAFRGQGGMHLLGRSVDRVRAPGEQAAALAACAALAHDGLVLVGGTFTNTDAAHLAEYFAAHQGAPGARRTAVVGVPVSIDGDIRNEFVETTLGHDTATKVYSQLVGNMATDSNSAKKYTYFIKLMGRTTGHITMEVALQTRPNIALLGAAGGRAPGGAGRAGRAEAPPEEKQPRYAVLSPPPPPPPPPLQPRTLSAASSRSSTSCARSPTWWRRAPRRARTLA